MKNLLSIAAAAGVILLCSGISRASANPPCPQLGHADGCNAIITLNPGGTASISITKQPAYDGIEDQLVGVINNSGQIIGSITLSGSGIFGFDGDGAFSAACNASGIATFACGAATPGDTTGYAGPNTSFTIVDHSNGDVNFAGGLPDGGTAVFSLEQPPSTSGFTVTSTHPTPEPGSLVLLGTGLAAAAFFLRKRLNAEAGA